MSLISSTSIIRAMAALFVVSAVYSTDSKAAEVWLQNRLGRAVTIRHDGDPIKLPPGITKRFFSAASEKLLLDQFDFEPNSVSAAVVVPSTNGHEIVAVDFPHRFTASKTPRQSKKVQLHVFATGEGEFTRQRISQRFQRLNHLFREHRLTFEIAKFTKSQTKTAELAKATISQHSQNDALPVVFGLRDLESRTQKLLSNVVFIHEQPSWSETDRSREVVDSFVRWFGGFDIPNDGSINGPREDLGLLKHLTLSFVTSDFQHGKRFADLTEPIKSNLAKLYKSNLANFPDDNRVQQLLIELYPSTYVDQIAEGMALRVKQTQVDDAQFPKLFAAITPSRSELPWLYLDWELDVSEARSRAAREDRPLLILIAADGNPAGRC